VHTHKSQALVFTTQRQFRQATKPVPHKQLLFRLRLSCSYMQAQRGGDWY